MTSKRPVEPYLEIKEGIDSEKWPTSPFSEVMVDHVKVLSRYRKADELDLMARILRELKSDVLSVVASMYCDSKASYCYTVTLKSGTPPFAAEILGNMLDNLFSKYPPHGHNGIAVEPHDIIIEPDWERECSSDADCLIGSEVEIERGWPMDDKFGVILSSTRQWYTVKLRKSGATITVHGDALRYVPPKSDRVE